MTRLGLSCLIMQPYSSKISQIPCPEVFGPPKGLCRRCLGVQTPTHKVFGRLGQCQKVLNIAEMHEINSQFLRHQKNSQL